MTAQPGNNQGNAAPQPAPGQEPPAVAPAPAYITADVFNAQLDALKSEFQESLNNTYRGIQSLTSKTKAQLDQLDGVIKQLNAAGQPVDQAVVQRVKTEIIAGAYNGDAQSPVQPAAAPGQEPPADPEDFDNDPVIQKLLAFQEVYGIELMDDDPEVKNIPDINKVGEPAFFAAVKEQLEAKKARLASDTPQRSIARSPILGSSGTPSHNPLAGVNDPDELWALANKK